MDNILTSIKKLLGIPEEITDFDPDLIMYINAALMVLDQIGIGPEDTFVLTDGSETWDELLEDDPRLEAVKSYIYFKVRLMFDPPQSSSANEAIKQNIAELEWRIMNR